jgi:hypothetical protein
MSDAELDLLIDAMDNEDFSLETGKGRTSTTIRIVVREVKRTRHVVAHFLKALPRALDEDDDDVEEDTDKGQGEKRARGAEDAQVTDEGSVVGARYSLSGRVCS